MSVSRALGAITLFLFFFPISYLIANILWFNNIDGKLFVETDRLIPLTNFLPPYIHNCCGDRYIQGWDEQKVAEVGRIYIYGIIFSSIALSILLYKPARKFLKGFEKELKQIS